MVSSADVLRATASRFLPIVAVTLVGAAVLVTGLNPCQGLPALRDVHWQIAVGEALAISAGYAGASLLLRRQVALEALRSRSRAAMTAAVAVAALLALSVFNQPAGLGRIGLLSMAAGAAAGFLVVGAYAIGHRGAAMSGRADR